MSAFSMSGAAYPAPYQAETGPRVDPAGQSGRQLGHDLAERVHEVGGQVRPGGVPAWPGDPDSDLVAGSRDRPAPDAYLSHVQTRVTVQREDAVHAGDAARGQHVERAARDLLGRLEDQPDPAGQCPGLGHPGQEQAGAQQDGRVHVVPAGVAGVRHGRPVRHGLLVRDGQRVQVRAQRHQGTGSRTVGPDVGYQPRPLGQDHRTQAGRGKPEPDLPCRPVLVIADLRMSMQVTTEPDQLAGMLGEERLEFPRQVISRHALPPQGTRTGLP
jgi:hypothetical protein